MALRLLWNLPRLTTPYHKNILTNTLRCTRNMRSKYSVNAGAKSEHIGTIQELSNQLAKTMGVEKGYRPIPASRTHLTKYLPKSQAELPPRSMKDSFLSALIPLSTDAELQEKYITFLGHVRVGRLLEDMDIFAVMVAQKHIKNPGLPEGVPCPQTLVTAFVDRIDFTNFIPMPKEDIKISGHVSWVGASSMEVVVWLEQNKAGTWHRITSALFLMASRDPTNTSPAMVNALVPADDNEKQIFSGGIERKKNRIALQKQHVSKMLPTQEEQRILHDLYMRTKSERTAASLRKVALPANGQWMEDCTISNSVFSHPENRNLHNTVFGGFLMRMATELSWQLGYRFTKYRPHLKCINDISFNKPVAVNSLLNMHSHVVFTHMQFVQISVFIEVLNASTGLADTTNVLNFTYEVPDTVREVFPRTYHEAMMYIDGRRHFYDIISDEPNGTVNWNWLSEEGIVNKSKL